MKITVKTFTPRTVSTSEMANNTFGIAISGEFKGELFYHNVAGLHGITTDRYWPSDYINGKCGDHGYIPNFSVQLLEPSDTLTVGQ